jgi:hypothetical protein
MLPTHAACGLPGPRPAEMGSAALQEVDKAAGGSAAGEHAAWARDGPQPRAQRKRPRPAHGTPGMQGSLAAAPAAAAVSADMVASGTALLSPAVPIPLVSPPAPLWGAPGVQPGENSHATSGELNHVNRLLAMVWNQGASKAYARCMRGACRSHVFNSFMTMPAGLEKACLIACRVAAAQLR